MIDRAKGLEEWCLRSLWRPGFGLDKFPSLVAKLRRVRMKQVRMEAFKMLPGLQMDKVSIEISS